MTIEATLTRHGALFAVAVLCMTALVTPAAGQIAFEDVSVPAGFGDSASETWGAAWGDIDGDLYPDIFVNNHRTRAKLYRNNGDGTFTDVSAQVDVSGTAGWTGARELSDKHGDAWGDIDNDGDQDLLLTVSTLSDRLLMNENGRLVDRTIQYGVDKLHHTETHQNILFDFNGDGRLDIASLSFVRPALSPQLPNGTFGAGSGVEIPTACPDNAQWAHLADVHPSPGLELVCAPRTGTYPRVNAFPGGGTVSDVTAEFAQISAVNDAVTFDYDRDLRPDIFIVRRAERPSEAYQFAPDRFEAQLTTGGNGKSVTFKSSGVLTITASLSEGDDAEGDPQYIDIGSINWSPSALTFELDPADPRNAGIGSSARGINVGYSSSSGEWTIAQGNGDYRYSYVQVSSTAPISELTLVGATAPDVGYKGLLQSSTADGFLDVSTSAGFTSKLACVSGVAGDFDNDMDEDLFLACTGGAHNIPNRLFMNNGDKTFTEIANAGGAAGKVGAAVAEQAGTSDSVVVADYDRDGFLDLFVTNGLNMRPVYIGGPKQLFHNRGNSNHWIELDLVGTTSNRDGTGSRVYATSGGIIQYREQNGGYHRWSQNSRRLHFGLGSNVSADVKVIWPDGTTTNYAGLRADRLYAVKQDGTVAGQELEVRFSKVAATVDEDAGTVTLTVSRVGPTIGAAQVNFSTSPGSASAGTDFTAVNGTLSWNAGDETDKTITVAIANDALNEPSESFTVALASPSGTVLGLESIATVSITDDDEATSSGGGTGGGGGGSSGGEDTGGGGGGGSMGPGELCFLLLMWVAFARCRRMREFT